jgi:hypothetical protein
MSEELLARVDLGAAAVYVSMADPAPLGLQYAGAADRLLAVSAEQFEKALNGLVLLAGKVQTSLDQGSVRYDTAELTLGAELTADANFKIVSGEAKATFEIKLNFSRA